MGLEPAFQVNKHVLSVSYGPGTLLEHLPLRPQVNRVKGKCSRNRYGKRQEGKK